MTKVFEKQRLIKPFLLKRFHENVIIFNPFNPDIFFILHENEKSINSSLSFAFSYDDQLYMKPSVMIYNYKR